MGSKLCKKFYIENKKSTKKFEVFVLPSGDLKLNEMSLKEHSAMTVICHKRQFQSEIRFSVSVFEFELRE